MNCAERRDVHRRAGRVQVRVRRRARGALLRGGAARRARHVAVRAPRLRARRVLPARRRAAREHVHIYIVEN